jgi:tRNA pseudouridine65 synthase
MSAPIPILHLDEHVVVVDKPAGLLVHRTGRDPTEEALLQRVRDQIGRPIFLAQRLDRDTSGVLACALSPQVVPNLQVVLTAPEARKEYLALVHGACPEAFTCDQPLVDDKGVARAACTSFARLADVPALDASLVLARLHTGRYQQIRRHLAGRGHAVLGDPFHGEAQANGRAARAGLRRLFLHAWRLDAAHPITGRLHAIAPLPPELAGVLDRLEITPPVASSERAPARAPTRPASSDAARG